MIDKQTQKPALELRTGKPAVPPHLVRVSRTRSERCLAKAITLGHLGRANERLIRPRLLGSLEVAFRMATREGFSAERWRLSHTVSRLAVPRRRVLVSVRACAISNTQYTNFLVGLSTAVNELSEFTTRRVPRSLDVSGVR